MFSKGGKRKPRALRHLALQELGLVIQEGEHSSVDDARAGTFNYVLLIIKMCLWRGQLGKCYSCCYY
jgi:hypothetical protein